MNDNNAAKVYILDAPIYIDRTFDYSIPALLRKEVSSGTIVKLPFGNGNRMNIGFVKETFFCEDLTNLKPISAIHDGIINSITKEDIELAEWMAEKTFCTFGEAVRCLLPTGALSFVDYSYKCNDEVDSSKLNQKAKTVFGFILTKGVASYQELKREFGDEVGKTLNALFNTGFLSREFSALDSSKAQFVDYYVLTDEWLNNSGSKPSVRGEKQKSVIEYLENNGRTDAKTLREVTLSSAQTLEGLIKKGYIEKQSEESYRIPYCQNACEGDEIRQGQKALQLTEEQQNAQKIINGLCDTHKPKAVLLRGVTGSGKTKVIQSSIDHVLESGRSVILLVPEIALIPQMVASIVGRYGDTVAVIHSALSNGERYDEWRRMKEKKARICVGTRSAVFAPLDDIGLIVIDEEQDSSYKSDQSPRYHARDIARFRCNYHNALMLLSSATPSIESAYKAQSGKYTLVEMDKRYGNSSLPDAEIVDLRGEAMTGPIGGVLAEELNKNLQNKEQSVLFVNRRGYNNFVTCSKCGETIVCKHCSVSMAYHTYGRVKRNEESIFEHATNGYLSCHWCGNRMKVPDVCPSCAEKSLSFMGFGTQMVESELESEFPTARLMRMDADTTTTKNSFDKMVKSFGKGEKDIMLGTQMVTKGHDFPNVTLVGIVLADSALYMDDYRAGERTFELIAQVIGRAGRASKNGRAIIQTYNPSNRIIEYGASQNYKAFYENEIAFRQSLIFPPFCDICLITFASSDEAEVISASDGFALRLKNGLAGEYKDVRMTAFGPFEAPIYKVGDKYRKRLVIKCIDNKRTREFYKKTLVSYGAKIAKKVTITIDMNPSSI